MERIIEAAREFRNNIKKGTILSARFSSMPDHEILYKVKEREDKLGIITVAEVSQDRETQVSSDQDMPLLDVMEGNFGYLNLTAENDPAEPIETPKGALRLERKHPGYSFKRSRSRMPFSSWVQKVSSLERCCN